MDRAARAGLEVRDHQRIFDAVSDPLPVGKPRPSPRLTDTVPAYARERVRGEIGNPDIPHPRTCRFSFDEREPAAIWRPPRHRGVAIATDLPRIAGVCTSDVDASGSVAVRIVREPLPVRGERGVMIRGTVLQDGFDFRVPLVVE